ncbi:MAG TPA: CvpA family protein [Candidatus Paceibacterota bacterium]|nr:CvpA family protein [Candidatus Paceibacterota bacterium]
MSFFEHLPFNWFDILIVIFVIIGIRRGRKHGMSEELIGMLAWLSIAIGCSVLYDPLGTMLSQSSVFSLLASYVMVYIGAAALIWVLSVWIKKALGGKLLGSDVFGGTEFYLGMVAGVVRMTCILIAGLALMNARLYTSAEIAADKKYQNDWYSNTLFPRFYELQAQVFNQSLAGPWIKRDLGFLLIKPTPALDKPIERKERQVFASP